MNVRNILIILILLVFQAASAQQFETITTTLGSDWDIDTQGGTDGTAFTGECDDSGGFTIEDAESADGDTDMYDNAWGIWVDDTAFAPGSFSVNGTEVTAGPMTLSGLDVSMEYLFSNVIEAGRILVTLSNPSGSAISVSVDVPANFGSDDSTTIVTTSSGDTTFDLSDTWVMTWDGSSEINTSVFYGPNGSVLPTSFTQTVFDCFDPDGAGATFDLTIPAGATQRLMFFAGIAEIDGTGSTDTANAAANAQQFSAFDTIDDSLTADLTDQERDSIVNWSPTEAAPSAPSVPVPALSVWALMLLAALMLVMSVATLIRRA